METETTQFGVRPFGCLNGDPKRFEVFDRRTGNAVVSGLRRDEAEADARRRNHDRSGPTGMAVCLGPLEVAALRKAIEAYLFLDTTGPDHQILEDLYALFMSWGT
jgi:hypothetical protein